MFKLPTVNDIIKSVDNSYLNGTLVGKWDIIDHLTLKPICTFDSFIGYQMRDTSNVPSQNIERGSFTSYNKINMPIELSIRLAKSGYPLEINQTLEQLKLYKDSTRLVDVILPYQTFLSYNITDISSSKSEGDAVSMLIVDLNLKEIREQDTSYAEKARLNYKNVKNPSDASTQDRGRQQAKQPSILYTWLK